MFIYQRVYLWEYAFNDSQKRPPVAGLQYLWPTTCPERPRLRLEPAWPCGENHTIRGRFFREEFWDMGMDQYLYIPFLGG